MAESVLKGCNVHWARSYQRVAEKGNDCVQNSNKIHAKDAFCIIAKAVTSARKKEDALQLFDVPQGASDMSFIQHLNIPLTDEHYTIVTEECDWSLAKSWVQWWTRPKHLQMLCKPFSVVFRIKLQETQME